MERSEKEVKAVHERDLDKLLQQLGIKERFDASEMKCKFCGTVVTLDNLYSVLPQSGTVHLICNLSDCIGQFHAYMHEKSITKRED